MRSQSRKLLYGLLIVALFGAMIPYSNWLEREKRREDLGEAAIGQVDTGSFLLKLALLGGARGVAANVLWTRAEELKREQDWDRMKTVVDLITKLQPHFLSVWTFQGWNLAYNVSVEWDAPEDKYDWIKKGIQFLQDGVQKNRKSPDLIWDTAWTYYHKIGMADESIILRRLFRDDDDEKFKTYTDYSDPRQPVLVGNDNFKLGFGWFGRAVNLVDEGASRLQEGTRDVIFIDPSPQHKGRPDDIAFRSMPAHAQTRYASALEKASTLGIPASFGEVAKNEWAKTFHEWVKFGSHVYMTHSLVWNKELGKWGKEPVQLDDATHPERFAKLTDNQKYWVNRWSDQMNYRYWKDRAAAEKTTKGVQARQLFYEGTIAYKSGDPAKTVEKFREGLRLWAELLKDHRDYSNDESNKKDTGLIVLRYLRALKLLGEPEPQEIPFRDLAQGAERDYNVDPFDANEMLGPTGLTESTAPGQGQGQGQGKPAETKSQAR
jgi:hypothetical protein